MKVSMQTLLTGIIFLEEVHLKPKLSLLLDEYIKFDVFYKSINKSNSIGDNENLEQHNLGVSFCY